MISALAESSSLRDFGAPAVETETLPDGARLSPRGLEILQVLNEVFDALGEPAAQTEGLDRPAGAD